MADDTLPARLRWACCRCDSQQCVACKAADEIERLRAEVDLKGYRVDDLLMHAEQDACEIERLRAAGDAMAHWYAALGPSTEMRDAVDAWQEARRG